MIIKWVYVLRFLIALELDDFLLYDIIILLKELLLNLKWNTTTYREKMSQ